MQKKILLLGRKHTIQKELVSDIHDQLARKLPGGYVLRTANYNDLIIDARTNDVSITIAENGEGIAEYDFVYMMSWYSYVPTRREMAFSIANYLHFHGVPFVNSEAFHSRSSSKISQMVIFALNGIMVPRTVFGLSKANVLDYLRRDDELSGMPLVAKDALASRGASNFLCKDLAQLAEIPIGQRESQPFIIQPFIPNEKKDWRVVVMAGRPRLIIERSGSGDGHLNNTSQGGGATLRETDFLPAEVLDGVIKAAALLHRDVTGVDVMRHKETGAYYILEANALPQLASGAFVDEKMQLLADMIVAKVSGKDSV